VLLNEFGKSAFSHAGKPSVVTFEEFVIEYPVNYVLSFSLNNAVQLNCPRKDPAI
jgi:hypothetical protein